jgi:hypothetical protein
MDFDAVNDIINNSNAPYLKEPSEKHKKIVINSIYLHEMRRRNTNS